MIFFRRRWEDCGFPGSNEGGAHLSSLADRSPCAVSNSVPGGGVLTGVPVGGADVSGNSGLFGIRFRPDAGNRQLPSSDQRDDDGGGGWTADAQDSTCAAHARSVGGLVGAVGGFGFFDPRTIRSRGGGKVGEPDGLLHLRRLLVLGNDYPDCLFDYPELDGAVGSTCLAAYFANLAHLANAHSRTFARRLDCLVVPGGRGC